MPLLRAERAATLHRAAKRFQFGTRLGTDGDGKVLTDFGSLHDRAYRAYNMAMDGNGKIVVAGESFNGANHDFALARYNADGSLDTSFDGDGKVLTDFGFSNTGEGVYSVAIDGNGRIVAAGTAGNGANDAFALARYNTDGSLDTTFNGSGKRTTDFGSGDDIAFDVAIQPDGKIVAAGQT